MPLGLTPREMLARLVAFPTVSTRSNLDLIAFVEDYLAGLGVASLRVPDATGDKAALVALVGPAVAGGVVLSGHTDVVPVDGQDWTQRPLDARRARRPALRPRHLRHEGLLRHRAGARPGDARRRPRAGRSCSRSATTRRSAASAPRR